MEIIETTELPGRRDGSYLEFDLDAETLTLVEELAAKERVTPFEMCVTLLRERLLK
jgi:hypothetical protein